MEARVTHLPFDSELFDQSCGVIHTGGTPLTMDTVNELIAEAHDMGIRHLVTRVPCKWVDTIGNFEATGFRFMVCSLELQKSMGENLEANNAVQLYQGGEDERLINITEESFNTNTRFHFEPCFDTEAATELHRKWIRNLIDDKRTMIFVHRKEGIITGYVTVKKEEKTRGGHIDLFAVDEPYRGAGIGLMLLQALEGGIPHSLDWIRVVTESINTSALKTYSKAEYEVRRSWTVLHCCLQEGS